MVSFPKYESYKDTSISWIQNIPTTWKIERAKWLFRKMERPIRPEDDVVTAFRDGEVTLRKNRREEGFTNAIQEHGYQGIRSGDLVISAMDAFAGAIGVSDSDGKSTPVYSVCIPSGEFYVNNYYYAYLIRYMAKSGFILSLSKGIRERSTDFRFNDFANLYLPIPSKEEQDKIVEFLDRKTAEIGQAIEQKQRLIKLLKEQKAILIDRAVTKGLNPNVPMRYSDVDWIGEIPKHWSIAKIKHIAKFISGGTPKKEKSEFWDGDIPWVSAKEMKQRYIDDTEDKITQKALQKTTLKLLEIDTIIVVVRGMILARKIPVALARTSVTINQDMKALLVDKEVCLPEYLLLLLEGVNHHLPILLEEAGHGTKTLPTEGLSNFKLPIPPVNEQLEIIESSKKKGLEIDSFIEVISQQILMLENLKQIIIAEAVIGKIKM